MTIQPKSIEEIMFEIDDYLGGNMPEGDFDWMSWTHFLRSSLASFLVWAVENVQSEPDDDINYVPPSDVYTASEANLIAIAESINKPL